MDKRFLFLPDYYDASVNKDHLLYKEEHSFQQGCKTCYTQECEMNSYKVRKKLIIQQEQ